MTAKQGWSAALLSTLVSIPAMANVGDIYASGKFGVSWQEITNISDSYPGHSQVPTESTVKETVLAYGGAVGFRWHGLYTPIRTEVDYTFRNDLSYKPSPVYVGDSASLKSDVQSQTILGNLIVDIPIIGMFGAFVGAGAGAALTTTTNTVTDTVFDSVTKSETDSIGVAWMATAGLSLAPVDWLALDLSYRYSDLGSALWNIADTTVDLTSNNYTANELFLTVRFTIPEEKKPAPRAPQYQPKQWKEPAPQPKPVTKAPAYNNKSPAYNKANNKAPEYNKAPSYNKQRAQSMKDK